MMQVVDCFLFAGELDMLECRLTELEEVVDWFVMVEGDRTFQGEPRSLVYEQHRERFARWSDRIVYVVAELPVEGTAWVREDAQREAIIDGLKALPLSPDDTVVVSDVDEIWRASIVMTDLPRPFTVLQQTMFVHHFGWVHPEPWDGPVVLHVEDIPPAEYGSFAIIRSCRLHERPPRVPNAGWHLSWFGGDEMSRRKLDSFSHTEFADVDIADHAARGLHVDGVELVEASADVALPRWVPAGWLP